MFRHSLYVLGAALLALAFLFVFFGGTWEGARIGLEVIGGLYLLQLAYNSLLENAQKEREAKVAKEIEKKYFS